MTVIIRLQGTTNLISDSLNTVLLQNFGAQDTRCQNVPLLHRIVSGGEKPFICLIQAKQVKYTMNEEKIGGKGFSSEICSTKAQPVHPGKFTPFQCHWLISGGGLERLPNCCFPSFLGAYAFVWRIQSPKLYFMTFSIK